MRTVAQALAPYGVTKVPNRPYKRVWAEALTQPPTGARMWRCEVYEEDFAWDGDECGYITCLPEALEEPSRKQHAEAGCYWYPVS